MEKGSKPKVIQEWHLTILVGAISILLIVGGYLFYSSEEKSIRKEKYLEIQAVAELKISQIVQWRKEKIRQAKIASEERFLNGRIKLWTSNRQNLQAKKEILNRFAQFKDYFGYENIFLLSPDGDYLLSLTPKEHSVESIISPTIKEVIKKQEITFIDLYYCPIHKKIHYDIVVPIINNKNISIAAMLFRIDPNDYLFPLLQKWPTERKTAETLLLRKDGDSILYLNKLWYWKNSALQFRIPLTHIEVPAVQAALRNNGIWRGKDYRGVDVLSVVQPIRGTPWLMVVKVDENEIYAELTFRAIFIGIFVLILILLSGAGLAWIYSSRQRNIYKELFDKEKELFESENRFHSAFENAAAGMTLTATDGKLLQVNKSFCRMLGYSESELLNLTFNEITHPDDLSRSRDFVVKAVEERVDTIQFEKRYLKKNSDVMLAEVSSSLLRDAEAKPLYFISLVIDITERKVAEDELKRTNTFIQTVLDNLPIGVALNTIDHGRALYLNKKFEEIYGWPKEELEDISTFFEKVYPDKIYRDGLVARIVTDIQSGDPSRMHWEDCVITHKDGSVHIINAVNIPLFEQNTMVSTVIDMTEIKKAEKAICESEEKYRTLVSQSPDGIFIFDLNGNFISANRAMYETLGYNEQEFLAMNIWDIIPKEYETLHKSRLKKIFEEGGIDQSAEYKVIGKDGSEFIVDISSVPYLQNGKCVGIQGVARDITIQKKAELAIKESEEKYRKLVQASPDGITIIGQDGKITYFSPKIKEIFAIADDSSVIGSDALNWIADEDRPKAANNMRELFQNNIPNVYRYKLLKHDGTVFYGEVSGAPLLDANSNLTAMIAITRDVTESVKALEEIQILNTTLEERVRERTSQLETTNKELESFSYSVSHDLRAPLRGIDGFSNILFEDYTDKLGEEGNRIINVIRKNTQKMGHLIDDLLAFSRIGSRDLVKAEIDMSNLANSVFLEITSKHEREKISFSISNLPYSKGDPSMIRQLWTNILSNAVKFSSKKEKSIIEVTNKMENGKIVYCVCDNGIGFDMKYYNKLFGVFHRLHREDEFQGTGVGLAIAKRIVTKHGGTIWAESEINVGTTFYFTV
ncbi:MAG: PAS domain S-box protein [Ignavibacteriaceae bacterium]|jgi:PAS domain S-box-containing protein